MTRIGNLEQAEHILAAYVPQVRELLGKDLTLARMQPFLERLGNPQDQLKVIHIAGTSGKTSTAYYLSALLTQTGKTVGLTVSPHLDSITERVQINLKPLSEAAFCQALDEVLGKIRGVSPQPTYFELMIAFVYWYFAKIGVDYAVIETGMGGKFDATNTAGKRDKICVITDIGLDHMNVLGRTLPEIAGQKAGIIHPGNQVFMHRQSPTIMAVFETAAKTQNATLNVLSNEHEESRGELGAHLGKLPPYQRRNWTLAKHVYDFIARRDSLPALSADRLESSQAVQVPGRMETKALAGKILIMDGAHNEQKMQTFVRSFEAMYPGKKAAILLAMKTGKEHEAVLTLLKPICDKLIITSFKTVQDLPVIATEPQVLADAARRFGFTDVNTEPDNHKALRQLIESSGRIAIVTGSFYLLSSLRPYILKA